MVMSLMLDENEGFSLTVNANRDVLGRFTKNHAPLNKTAVMINCNYCGKTFERIPKHIRASNYCSMNCYKELLHSRMPKVICNSCGKKFSTHPARLKIGRGKYCSRECFNESIKGRIPCNKGKILEEIVGKEKASKIKSQIATKAKDYWKKSAYVKKQMRARGARPNHQERFMVKCFSFLQYVGDGTLIIGGKCPDFKVEGQRKLVELFGNYWHSIAEETQRINYFKKYGWDCLVVWDSELKNDFTMVDDKMHDFVGQPK